MAGHKNEVKHLSPNVLHVKVNKHVSMQACSIVPFHQLKVVFIPPVRKLDYGKETHPRFPDIHLSAHASANKTSHTCTCTDAHTHLFPNCLI